MSETTIENAKIRSTMLGREDHGIMTAYIEVEAPGWGCAFGGYVFDEWQGERGKDGRRVGNAYGTEFIARVLATLEVSSWERLPGTVLRVETEGWGGRIRRIGHFLKDQWFDPKALADEMRRAGERVV